MKESDTKRRLMMIETYAESAKQQERIEKMLVAILKHFNIPMEGINEPA